MKKPHGGSKARPFGSRRGTVILTILFPTEKRTIPFGNWMVKMVLKLGLSKKYQPMGLLIWKPFSKNQQGIT